MDAKFHHVAMAVKDMDRAVKFYRDLLGFEVDWESPHHKGEAMSKIVGLPEADARITMLKGYGVRVELFHYYSPEGKDLGPRRQCDYGLTHMALRVRDLKPIHEKLAAAGVEFNCTPQNLRPGVWVTYMKDLEGNTIELVQYSEDEVKWE